MRYWGAQFRMARAATRAEAREICDEAAMSAGTLRRIELAGEIEYGVKQRGKFEEETIAKLVTFYEKRGVAFLSSSSQGVGIRFDDRGLRR